MKSIINGKRYDTDKAILVGATDSGGSYTDFSHWSAGLYRTPRSGRFFLAGSGGPMTRWARSVDCGNSRTGSEAIFEMTGAEALAWAEEYLMTSEIEEHFADAIEDA